MKDLLSIKNLIQIEIISFIFRFDFLKNQLFSLSMKDLTQIENFE